MARAGTGVVDDVFLGGATSRERLRAGLRGLEVLQARLRCDPRRRHLRHGLLAVLGLVAAAACGRC